MSDEQGTSSFNLLSGSDASKVLGGSWDFSSFDTKEPEFGTPYALSVTYDSSADGLWFQARFNYWTADGDAKNLSDTPQIVCAKGKHVATVTIPSFDRPDDFASAVFMVQAGDISGKGTIAVSRPMLVEGTEPAAWAPAEGETLAGGGALMSANLWDTSKENIKPDAGGVYTLASNIDTQCPIAGTSALEENQIVHMGASLRGAGSGFVRPYVGYKDAAGNWNWTGFKHWTPTDDWQRFEDSCIVPSGMTISVIGFNTYGITGTVEMTNPAFSYGTPVTLASSAHTPYATQDHVAAEYATKASLSVTNESIKAEVAARTKTDKAVSDLSAKVTQTSNSLSTEVSDRKQAIATVTGLANAAQTTADTAKTNAAAAQSTADTAKTNAATAQSTADGAQSAALENKSSITQLSDSITSLVKGEATYTAPDGTTKTSGIYSKIEQTAAGINETFGSYTKTADLAATQAVKDAKKAGTDAASAASAAQSTADTAKANASTAQSTANTAVANAATAQSTADAAKTAAANAQSTANTANTTANNLATLIHSGSDGVTVGYSTDGKTFTSGRTRQGTSSFDVLDGDGNTLSSLAKDQVSLLNGLAKLTATQETTTTEQSGTLSYDVLKINSQYEMLHADHRANISAECSGANTSGVATNSTAGITVMSYDDTSKTVGASLMGYVSDTDTTDWSLNSASFQLTPEEFNVQADAVTTSKDLKVGGVAQLPGGLAVGGGSKIVCVYYGTDTPKLSGTATAWLSSSAFKAKAGVDPSQTKCAVFVSNGDWDSYVGNLTAGYQPSTKYWNLYADKGVSGHRIRINYMIVVWA